MEMGLYLTPVLKASCWLWSKAGFALDCPYPGLRWGQTDSPLPTVSQHIPLPSSQLMLHLLEQNLLPSVYTEQSFLPGWEFGAPGCWAREQFGTPLFTPQPRVQTRRMSSLLFINIRRYCQSLCHFFLPSKFRGICQRSAGGMLSHVHPSQAP